MEEKETPNIPEIFLSPYNPEEHENQRIYETVGGFWVFQS
jgi:hypothetical protein